MSGVGMYGPRCCRLHATSVLEVAPLGSVMSPEAPARMTKIGASGRRPLATTIRLPDQTGVGAVICELPPRRHSSLPVSGSYPRMNLDPFVTSSLRPAPA